jgi:hypothetical protein
MWVLLLVADARREKPCSDVIHQTLSRTMSTAKNVSIGDRNFEDPTQFSTSHFGREFFVYY